MCSLTALIERSVDSYWRPTVRRAVGENVQNGHDHRGKLMNADVGTRLREIRERAVDVLRGLDLGESSDGFQTQVRTMLPKPLSNDQRRARSLANSLQNVIDGIDAYLQGGGL